MPFHILSVNRVQSQLVYLYDNTNLSKKITCEWRLTLLTKNRVSGGGWTKAANEETK